jgi:hypothetical protein
MGCIHAIIQSLNNFLTRFCPLSQKCSTRVFGNVLPTSQSRCLDLEDRLSKAHRRRRGVTHE